MLGHVCPKANFLESFLWGLLRLSWVNENRKFFIWIGWLRFTSNSEFNPVTQDALSVCLSLSHPHTSNTYTQPLPTCTQTHTPHTCTCWHTHAHPPTQHIYPILSHTHSTHTHTTHSHTCVYTQHIPHTGTHTHTHTGPLLSVQLMQTLNQGSFSLGEPQTRLGYLEQERKRRWGADTVIAPWSVLSTNKRHSFACSFKIGGWHRNQKGAFEGVAGATAGVRVESSIHLSQHFVMKRGQCPPWPPRARSAIMKDAVQLSPWSWRLSHPFWSQRTCIYVKGQQGITNGKRRKEAAACGQSRVPGVSDSLLGVAPRPSTPSVDLRLWVNSCSQ